MLARDIPGADIPGAKLKGCHNCELFTPAPPVPYCDGTGVRSDGWCSLRKLGDGADVRRSALSSNWCIAHRLRRSR